MLNKNFIQAATLLGASIIGSGNAMAQEGPAELSAKRIDTIYECITDTNKIIEGLDTRRETNIDFGLYDEGNRNIIKTAIKYGDFEEDVRALSLLGEMTSLLMFLTNQNVQNLCALYADATGALPKEVLEELEEVATNFYEYDAMALAIMKKLKNAGQALIDSGAAPISNDPLDQTKIFRDIAPSDFE